MEILGYMLAVVKACAGLSCGHPRLLPLTFILNFLRRSRAGGSPATTSNQARSINSASSAARRGSSAMMMDS